jgi:hypothetical protein
MVKFDLMTRIVAIGIGELNETSDERKEYAKSKEVSIIFQDCALRRTFRVSKY